MPVIIAGNEQQQKKYLGRMIEEPLMCVSRTWEHCRMFRNYIHRVFWAVENTDIYSQLSLCWFLNKPWRLLKAREY